MPRPGMSRHLRRWRNWNGRVQRDVVAWQAPTTSVELRRTVGSAVQSSRRIKPVGAGHSFTEIAVPDDILLDLSQWTGLVAHDRRRCRVTVRSGTRLWQLGRLLDGLGLGMPNLGDIDRQSVAGAIATGTHGTGAEFGSLSAQVVGLTMINGLGEEIVVDDSDVDLLNACRVSLGALGVITEVTLQCVPAFDLQIKEHYVPMAGLTAGWRQRRTAHDHFEAFWFGRSDRVIVRELTRRPRAVVGPGWQTRARRWFSDEVMDNGALAAMCELGRLRPGWIPGLNRLSTRLWGETNSWDRAPRGFIGKRRVRFTEMEYGFAVESVPRVLDELQELFHQAGMVSSFLVEIRVAAPDQAWLSMSYGRATGYLAVHQYAHLDPEPLFSAAETIFARYDGRPHWGKTHSLGVTDLVTRYPRMADFVALRDRHDPQRLFGNDYLARVLGD